MSESLPALIGVVVALAGSGGIVFAALRFNRQEAGSFVDIMRGLNDELQEALDRTRRERDDLNETVEALRDECSALRSEVRLLREAVGRPKKGNP